MPNCCGVCWSCRLCLLYAAILFCIPCLFWPWPGFAKRLSQNETSGSNRVICAVSCVSSLTNYPTFCQSWVTESSNHGLLSLGVVCNGVYMKWTVFLFPRPSVSFIAISLRLVHQTNLCTAYIIAKPSMKICVCSIFASLLYRISTNDRIKTTMTQGT